MSTTTVPTTTTTTTTTTPPSPPTSPSPLRKQRPTLKLDQTHPTTTLPSTTTTASPTTYDDSPDSVRSHFSDFSDSDNDSDSDDSDSEDPIPPRGRTTSRWNGPPSNPPTNPPPPAPRRFFTSFSSASSCSSCAPEFTFSPGPNTPGNYYSYPPPPSAPSAPSTPYWPWAGARVDSALQTLESRLMGVLGGAPPADVLAARRERELLARRVWRRDQTVQPWEMAEKEAAVRAAEEEWIRGVLRGLECVVSGVRAEMGPGVKEEEVPVPVSDVLEEVDEEEEEVIEVVGHRVLEREDEDVPEKEDEEELPAPPSQEWRFVWPSLLSRLGDDSEDEDEDRDGYESESESDYCGSECDYDDEVPSLQQDNHSAASSEAAESPVVPCGEWALTVRCGWEWEKRTPVPIVGVAGVEMEMV